MDFDWCLFFGLEIPMVEGNGSTTGFGLESLPFPLEWCIGLWFGFGFALNLADDVMG